MEGRVIGAAPVPLRTRGEAIARGHRRPVPGVPTLFPSIASHRDADERAVRASLASGRLRAPAVASVKDQERVIPLNAVALAALDQLKATKDRPSTEPVFPSGRTGDSLQGSRGWFWTALDAAKVPDYTWHCNRHTFASRLVMAGV